MATEITKITTEMVQQLLPQRTEQEWADMRQEFLTRGYVECSLCTRLVSPAFIREVPGIGAVALCPDRQGRHAGRLGPTRLQALMRAYAQAKARQPGRAGDEGRSRGGSAGRRPGRQAQRSQDPVIPAAPGRCATTASAPSPHSPAEPGEHEMPPIVEQLTFELPEPASDHVERLLAEGLARDAGEELGDAA